MKVYLYIYPYFSPSWDNPWGKRNTRSFSNHRKNHRKKSAKLKLWPMFSKDKNNHITRNIFAERRKSYFYD